MEATTPVSEVLPSDNTTPKPTATKPTAGELNEFGLPAVMNGGTSNDNSKERSKRLKILKKTEKLQTII